MRRLHPVRRFSVVALVSMASVGAVTASGPAGASGGTVACTTLNGNQISPSVLFSCNPSDTTGGAGTIATPIFSGTHTGTIDWSAESLSQHATTVIHVTTHSVKRNKAVCPTGTRQFRISGQVRSDSSGSVTVGGTVSGTICRQANGSFALAPTTSFLIG